MKGWSDASAGAQADRAGADSEKRLTKPGKMPDYFVVLKHSHLYYYRNQDLYLSNDQEVDVFWLKFCRIKEIHEVGSSRWPWPLFRTPCTRPLDIWPALAVRGEILFMFMCGQPCAGRYLLGVYDLRLDKMLVLSFDSGLAREDWCASMRHVQETITKGLIPVRTCQYHPLVRAHG